MDIWSEPKIDGLVTDDAWLRVDPYKGFTQQEPIEGAPASEETEVRIPRPPQT